MANLGEGGSSKKGDSDKMKGTWKEESKAPHHITGSSSYRLFPEPRHTDHNMAPLLDIFSTDQHVMLSKQQDNPRSEVLTLDLPKISTKAQTQIPFQTMKQPICLSEGEDINANEADGVNVQIQMSNLENNVPVFVRNSWFSGAPQQASQATLINHGRTQSSYLPSHAPRQVEGSIEDFGDIMAVQQAYLCALHDPDQITPMKLLHQSPQALKDHYAHNLRLMSHSGESTINATTQHTQRISGSSNMQHFVQNNINPSARVQPRIMINCVKGQIVGLCTNPHGSRLIQQALEIATPEEIIMVYEEVIPYAQMLTIDVFANYAVQKILEHGPQAYKRKFINNLIGQVLPLSLHMYGCRVIQKAFEVVGHNLKLQMANEFRGEVLKCACDQYANHVLQKCIECVPAHLIQFIFRSFRRKVKTLSTTPYGCHVIQKVLTFCDNLQIYHTLVSEVMEAVVKLAVDPFGNYVVQHVVEHGGPVERSMIVKKFQGRVMSMSYQKYASNVIEKCLTFGSFQDRQLIATEILTAGDGQHFDHLQDMMCHLYANFVIQKLVTAADEGQLRLLVEVAHRNMANIMRYQHGRHVLAHIQKTLTKRGIMPSDQELLIPNSSRVRQAVEE